MLANSVIVLGNSPRRTESRLVTDETRQEEHRTAGAGEPWWAGFGAVGGVALIVCGAALGVSFVLFSDDWQSVDGLMELYSAARVVAIGLVVAGAALLSRRKRRAEGTDAPARPDGV